MTGHHRTTVRYFAALAACTLLAAAPAAAQTEIVLHTKNATNVLGDWQLVSDTTAAGGARMWNPDRGQAKVSTASGTPYDYFELTFTAEAGRAYRLWLRGKADQDGWSNDSAYVQFSGSLSPAGGPQYRIGTTDAASVSIEACGGCGTSGWGWEDNGYDSTGQLVYFATTGLQTIRVQRREDGISIDQIVLSASKYLTSAPGGTKNDATILVAGSGTTASSTATTSSGAEIAIPVATTATLRGDWQMVTDSTAAAGVRLWNPDRGAAKLNAPLASPSDYFEVTFNAEAGRGYRLWLRGKAQNDSWSNDSVFVQFNGSVTSSGSAINRIGTTSGIVLSIERGTGLGLLGWGWEDNGWDSLGPLVYFATTGPQTIRVQRREDGVSIDQIVLSAQQYLTTAPGAAKNDTTIIVGGTTSPTPTQPAPAPAPAPAPPPPPPPSGSPVRLRVLHWNIHHGVGTDNRYDIDRLATWMARMTPDVITLNEVEKFTSWGNEDQPARFKALLAAKTGKTWYMHFTQEFGAWSSNGKGHLILSVYPFQSTGRVVTTQSSGLNGAGAAAQATIIVNGRTVNLIVGHLDPYDLTMRLTQAKDVLRWGTSFAENRILTGDMNAWPDQSSIAEINKTYYDSWTTATNLGTAVGVTGITPFGATKKGRIDYIFYSKQASSLVVLDSKVWDTRDSSGHAASDHRPVVTTFEVR